MIRLTCEPLLGGGLDTALCQDIDRVHGLFEPCPRLYLDDSDHVAAPRDQIDLPELGSVASANDAIAFQHERERGKAFGGTAPAVRFVPRAPTTHFIASNR